MATGHPPGPLSNSDLQERERHDRELEELQQTFKISPGASTSNNCSQARRNPHPDFMQCAIRVQALQPGRASYKRVPELGWA